MDQKFGRHVRHLGSVQPEAFLLYYLGRLQDLMASQVKLGQKTLLDCTHGCPLHTGPGPRLEHRDRSTRSFPLPEGDHTPPTTVYGSDVEHDGVIEKMMGSDNEHDGE